MSILSKWGNSLGLRLPKLLVEKAKLRPGDRIDISLSESGHILLTPIRKNHTLDELVAGITPQNRHAETDWGEAQGREAW